MEPTKGILIKTFGNIADADLAAGELRAQGIDCVISTDDCAGMYPSMGVIQLLVEAKIADDARRILGESSAVSLTIPTGKEVEDLPAAPSLPRVFKFNVGLLIGVFLGALLHFGYVYQRAHRDGIDQYDRDGDGVDEEIQVWRGGENIETKLDRNGDARADMWAYYRKSLVTREEIDDNFDGKPDGWFTYASNGFLLNADFDTDCNGVQDMHLLYSNGVPLQADWRPNGTNVILLRQFFRHSALVEELRDLNGDGIFDVSIQFDPFMTPIHTNNLRPTIKFP